MKFCITFGFKNGLDFQFSADFLLKTTGARYASPTHKIFKRKKTKKKKAIITSGGFQKSKFF
jgi:hypothetical protein